MSKMTRREFGAVAAAGILLPQILGTRAEAADNGATTGPMIGHTDTSSTKIWFRPSTAGEYTLEVKRGRKKPVRFVATASVDDDLCITWHVGDLKTDTRYSYRILDAADETVGGGDDDASFRTAPDSSKSGKVCLAFGSCARMDSLTLFDQMHEQGAQGVVLLGDTPYIDTTNLAVARDKHRQFLQIPPLANLIRKTPTWGTWDDHDFGKNNSDGTLPGKENSRKAFVEYRANAEFGHDDVGIYTKFRYGSVEVFILDTRWFSRTEKSPVDSEKPTLLGARQWEWLKESLKDSTAPFKIITCGMIWDDKENGESDDWDAYSYERSALFDFLGEHDISGVLLIGGDIHCSRLLQYKTEEQVGYALRECIVSPMHNSVIRSLNVPHPDLIEGAAIPHVWLKVEVDTTKSPATLDATWVQMNNRKMWSLSLTEDDMKRV